MERDTDEWRRPWTTEGDAAGGSRTVRRVVRPRPSTLGTASASDRSADAPAIDGADTQDMVTAADAGVATGSTTDDTDAGRSSRTIVVPGGATVPGGQPAGDGPPDDDGGAAATGDGDGRGRGLLSVALVAALVGGVAGAGATLVATRDDSVTNQTAVGAGRGAESDAVRSPVVESVAPEEGQTTVTAVANAVLPSVVRIDVLAEQDDEDLGTVDAQIGVGSGVVYRSDGFILTNNHVVADADALEVQFSDGTSAPADIVGTDRLTDLAVLRVDRDGLPAATLRQDRALEVGETAVAIGSPFGLDASVTAGVVSALNRDLTVPDDGDGSVVIAALIQTDAAINPGNSGGALVDASGQLIGINTAILTGSGGSQGVGFAIPTRSAVIAAEQLIERGFVSHPFLGISGLDVTTEVEARYRDEFGLEVDGGALVDQVVEGSGADEGGVESGDVIISLGGDDITSMTDVISGILQFDPGDTVDVVVLRDGERVELEITLGERPR